MKKWTHREWTYDESVIPLTLHLTWVDLTSSLFLHHLYACCHHDFKAGALSNAKKNLIRISDHEKEKDFGYVYGVSGPGIHSRRYFFLCLILRAFLWSSVSSLTA